MRLTSLRGAARSGHRAKPHFPRIPEAGDGSGVVGRGRRAKLPPGVAAGVRIAAGERRGRNGLWVPWARGAGIPRCRPRCHGPAGFLAGLLLRPPDSVAKDLGAAERRERTLPF